MEWSGVSQSTLNPWAGMKLARWLIGISCAVGIVSPDSKAFSQPGKQGSNRDIFDLGALQGGSC
jgi:hypothetical protein